MRNSAESSTLDASRAPAPRTILPLPVDDPAEREARDELVRRLAADRLRDLRDDGVTLAYVARMYAVEVELLEKLSGELVPRRPR